jgi:hypothetical protein
METPPFPARHRNGKVARLPKALRQKINEMLDDGLPYAQIIQNLGVDGQDLNDDNIARWKAGGYQDHLRELRLIDQCRARRQHAMDLSLATGAVPGFQATQQIASAQICEVIADLGPDILRDAILANPLNYFRMLNAFTRLTNGGLKCERHVADEAERQARLEDLKTPARKKGLSPEALQEMNEKLNLM